MPTDLNSAANQFFSRREAMRPNARTWAKHIGLLLITFCTVTIAGLLPPFGKINANDIFASLNPQTWTETFYALLALPGAYVHEISRTIDLFFTDPIYRNYGLSFSLSLLFILTSHEMGHYIACRIYGVDATLPFFIPTPPLLGPAGTFGAFIKIVSPLPSRRATFDIGVAGPIAGFIALIPVALIGFLTMQQAAPGPIPNAEAGQIIFSDPLFFHFLAALFGIDLATPMSPNPFYSAAWLGLLVTSLNLITSGQLDGGHAIYSVFGEKTHRWTGRIAFVAMVGLAISGFYFYNSPSGLLFAVLLGIMMRIRHPEPLDNTPLDFGRRTVAFLTLLIFILSFMPFPIQIR
jgi:membrane-associated protease RseP (regulator of RpoE activity)